MSVANIKAHMICDGCGRPFVVEMDPAASLRGDQYLVDLLHDHMRGEMLGMSIQGDHELCGPCTTIVDNAFDDDHVCTHAEVAAVLDKHANA